MSETKTVTSDDIHRLEVQPPTRDGESWIRWSDLINWWMSLEAKT